MTHTLSFCGPCFQINRPPGCVWAVKTIPKLLAVLLIPGISPGPPWERTQQNSCLHFLLQLKDGCFPRGRSFEAETRWSYGPGDRKQIFPSFFKHLKRIIPVARYFREKKYEELVPFLPFLHWPFLLPGIEEGSVTEIQVLAAGRQMLSPPSLHHWAGQKMIVLGVKDLRLPWVRQSVRVNQGWHF